MELCIFTVVFHVKLHSKPCLNSLPFIAVDSVLNQAIGEAGEFDGKVYIPGRDEPTIMVTGEFGVLLSGILVRNYSNNGASEPVFADVFQIGYIELKLFLASL